MRRNTCTSEPLDSPAFTMLTYRSEKTRGCRAIASERPRPSVTSDFNSRLTSAGMPRLCKCVMLFSATVSGIPDCSKFASWVVNVASSCNFGLRFCDICSRMDCGRKEVKFTPPLPALFVVVGAPGFISVTASGKSPERWICASAAARSGTSSTPSMSSPERLRALYENCGIKSCIQNRAQTKVANYPALNPA